MNQEKNVKQSFEKQEYIKPCVDIITLNGDIITFSGDIGEWDTEM